MIDIIHLRDWIHTKHHGTDIRIKFNVNKLNSKFENMHQKLTEEIKKDTSEYVPYASGYLDKSAHIINAGENRKEIVWDTPYARFQYYGSVMRDSYGRTSVGKGEKKPYVSNKMRYSKDIHPKATSFWTIVSKNQHMGEWIEKAKRFFSD